MIVSVGGAGRIRRISREMIYVRVHLVCEIVTEVLKPCGVRCGAMINLRAPPQH